MISPDIFAYIATMLNILMLIPQVIQTFKSKDAKSLSLITLLLFLLANVLWLVYGIEIAVFPLILSNAIMGTMNLTLIALKLKYSQKSSLNNRDTEIPSLVEKV